jgi:uncharacterized protein YvpB
MCGSFKNWNYDITDTKGTSITNKLIKAYINRHSIVLIYHTVNHTLKQQSIKNGAKMPVEVESKY